MYEKMIDVIASLAIESMLFEVSATPKPGLVDRNNCGAHYDMDYFTFMSSAASLHSSFDEMIRLGFTHRNRPIQELLIFLRESGKRAEDKMFLFTKGVNTHKGMIFTLGILCGCAGWMLEKEKLECRRICENASQMCQGICDKEYRDLDKKSHLTKGEKMYLAYGCKGVRGEVESGYQTVQKVALPMYQKMRDTGHTINDSLVQTLLALIAHTEDTNIISRHDRTVAQYARQYAGLALKKGGVLTDEGKRIILEMDNQFIKKYVSPGGCADLLAVTHFLYSLEKSELINNYIVADSMMIK